MDNASTDPDGPMIFLALHLPGAVVDTTDPDTAEEWADLIRDALNAVPFLDGGDVEVGAIPMAQWLSASTLSRLRAASDARQAIIDEGPAPAHHRAVMARHRAEWPTLWAALDRLVS